MESVLRTNGFQALGCPRVPLWTVVRWMGRSRAKAGGKTGKPERKRRRGMRPDQLELAATARAMGLPWHEIAAAFRDRFRVNGLVAMRLAHGWSQRDAAEAWNARWPDDLKTFKNFSYWENWPSPTGYAPSLSVLARLAELYECAVFDLLLDAPDFRHLDPHYGVRPEVDQAPRPQALAVALEGVLGRLAEADVEEVAAAGLVWAERLPRAGTAYGLLMKLSAGLGLAATAQAGLASISPPAGPAAPPSEEIAQDGLTGRDEDDELVGIWRSRCEKRSGRLPGDHVIVLRRHRDRLLGQSLPHPAGARLRLHLDVDGQVVSGTWSEHPGQGRGGPAYGSVRFVFDPEQRVMRGRWLGYGDDGFHVHSGEWELTYLEPAVSGSALLAHRSAA